MNIFILDWDHETCVQWHCDKHVVKMPLETCQMLSTVHHRYSNDGPYKPVHQKHPCTLWAGQTVENYRWLWKLGIELCKEYTYRYEKTHACERILALLRCPPISLKARGFTKPAQAMPEEYKHGDTVVAYRNYYIHEKARLSTWRKRPTPLFMQGVMSSPSPRGKTAPLLAERTS
mgnify:FL=1